MAYYDNIADQWHANMGTTGDAFKELILNELLLEKLGGIDRQAILELGAGNGYFLPFVLRRLADQVPATITITDQSERQLEIAQQNFAIQNASYQKLDVEYPFPFEDQQFDLIVASMLFNEVSAQAMKRGLRECHRVLKPAGHLLMTVTHPAFIERLRKSGALKPEDVNAGALTMPSAGSLRLPVVERSVVNYRRALQDAGFTYDEDEAYATPEVLKVKAGLRNTWKIPIALIYTCPKAA